MVFSGSFYDPMDDSNPCTKMVFYSRLVSARRVQYKARDMKRSIPNLKVILQKWPILRRKKTCQRRGYSLSHCFDKITGPTLSPSSRLNLPQTERQLSINARLWEKNGPSHVIAETIQKSRNHGALGNRAMDRRIDPGSCYGPLTNNFRLANQPIDLSTYRGNWPTVQPVGQRGLVGEWIAPVGQQIKTSDLFINFNLPVR